MKIKKLLLITIIPLPFALDGCNKKYYIEDLYFSGPKGYPSISLENLIKINLSYYVSSIDPKIEKPKEYTSEHISDFEYNVDVIKNMPVTKIDDFEIDCDADYHTYSFYYKNSSEQEEPYIFQITLVSGRYFTYEGRHFQFESRDNFKITVETSCK